MSNAQIELTTAASVSCGEYTKHMFFGCFYVIYETKWLPAKCI